MDFLRCAALPFLAISDRPGLDLRPRIRGCIKRYPRDLPWRFVIGNSRSPAGAFVGFPPIDFESFGSDLLEGFIRKLPPVELVEAELDLAFQVFEFELHQGIVVFFGSEHEGGATVFGDGNGTGAGAVEDLAELLFGDVGGDRFHFV